ncbi:MAG: sulfate ABC transporter substrate-binding protein [Planctomycetota bacterium]|jgi:sulfate/thiosulfate-binding protein
MKWARLFSVLSLGALALALGGGCGKGDRTGEIELINVSYDPTRELYQQVNEAFVKDYQAKTGKPIKVTPTHGGSGAQARSVIDGLEADVVTLALASDIEAIEKKGLINADWQSRLPNNSCPYTSTIVFVTRAGNPKNIKDWSDLVKDGVKVITPNPKTSGGARWNFVAAWGFVTIHQKGSDADAEEFVRKLYKNVPKLDTGARGSTETFARRNLGDVAISWENEAFLLQKEFPNEKFEVIYPSISVLAEPPVAVVDQVVDKRKTRQAAEDYLKFMYTEPAQVIVGKNGYRPNDPANLKKYAPTLPEMTMFTIRDVAGSWKEAQKRFFADGGVFDKIYQPKAK